jgi:hypothetical protein
MRTKLRCALACQAVGLALAGVLALPATAAATIVPGHGVAGVELGASAAKITAVLGKTGLGPEI